MKNLKFLLDVGSSKICLYACTTFKSSSVIVASSEQLYDGFMDGEFFEPTQITDVVQKLIADMSAKLKVRIKKVYVGVPSEFSICVCKRKVRKYLNVVKLNSNIVLELFDDVQEFEKDKGYKLISFSPMQYQLDSGFKTIHPEGKRSSQVVLDASYILVKQSFINTFDKVLRNLSVKEIEYVSTILGQALVVNKDEDSLTPVAIVDVGHITTSVAIIKGEGLALLSSFSLGGGHITADIMQLLKKSFKDAETIKRKVALTIKPKKDEKYIINNGVETISSHIQITNDIVRSRIENIAQIVANILDIDKAFSDIKIYLTGDGIAKFKGVTNILEQVTKRKVEEFKVPFDNSQEKFQTSKIGLAELVSRLK
ncbi:MAG: rod shape-determining protein [Clostridia bacterium]|nr:rod shape-determining protein [Clostridia bacterium]